MKNAGSRKNGSAYLMAIGVLGILVIIGFSVSRLTVSGRWSTVFSSHEKYAEECAESAANLTFKVVKENMNDYNAFWKLFSKPKELMKSWFMYFRLPAPVAGAYIDPISFDESKANGLDVQLDLFNNGLFKPLYEKGILYVYDTIANDESSPLSPLKNMFTSRRGRMRVETTARIKSAFGILASNPKFKIGGIDIPLKRATGFLGSIFDKIKIAGGDIFSGDNDDPTGDSDMPSIDILGFLPDTPLLKAPDITGIKILVQGALLPVGYILQPLLDKIFDKITTKFNLTPRGLATTIFGDVFNFKIDFTEINKKISEAIQSCLPEFLHAFAGNATFDITVEKQGFFEVVSEIEYWPDYPHSDKTCIKKKLITHREFRVADIQPIASDYSFFVANSKLLYETDEIENSEEWEGDDQINWDEGAGALIIHNMPSLKAIANSFKNLFTFEIKKLARELALPGLVRVNGTKEMLIKLTMFTKWPFGDDALDILKRIEVVGLLTPHKDSDIACSDIHPDGSKKHNVIPDLKAVYYNFFAKGEPFDWPYFGGGKPGGNGTYWLPFPPQMVSNLLFGHLHIEFPLSMRVEGYLKKVYSHIKMLLVKILIPPIPIIGFLGLEIPIPWFWATAQKEPYGFCQFPPYKSDEEAAKAWDPNKSANLPANAYAPSQYLKKASYFYNTSQEFSDDLENRIIDYDGKRVFVCDGVTFVNDNLWLNDDMLVMGRGILVAAGNVHLKGNIKRIAKDINGNSTLFSIVARNGSLISHFGDREIHACLFGDKGIQTPIGSKLKIYGNLVLNRFNRKDMDGDVHVYYESNHCRSSLLSMIRPVAKWDPTRYYVTLSAHTSYFKFEKI